MAVCERVCADIYGQVSDPALNNFHPQLQHQPDTFLFPLCPQAQCQQNGGILIIIFQIHFKTDKLLQSVGLTSLFPNIAASLVFIPYFVVLNVAIHDCWVELFILHHLLY